MVESLHTLPLGQDDFVELQEMIAQLSDWQGSLEDATVVHTAICFRCPVWTYNYRDFTAFKSLEFWTPAGSFER